MANGKISVELRLVLDKLNQDIRNAASSIKAGLSKDLGQTASGTDKAAAAMDKLDQKIRKTTSSIRAQKEAMLDAWRKSLPQMRIVDTTDPSGRKRPTVADTWSTTAGGGINLRGSFKDKPPIIPPPIIPKSLQWKDYVANQLRSNAGPISYVGQRLGLPLNATMLRAGGIGAALVGVVATLLAFKKAIRETSIAMERSRSMYFSAMRGGGGLGYQVQKSTMASVLGVSENEVLKFGRAVMWLGNRLNTINKVNYEYNRILSAAAIDVRIAKSNFDALKTTIAAQLAPVVGQLANVFSSLFESIASSNLPQIIGGLMANALNTFKNAVMGLAIAFQMALLQLQAFIDLLHFGFSRYSDKKGSFESSRGILKSIQNMIYGVRVGAMPQAVTSTNRLQASAWERMGLVVGTVASNNYQRDTARNTKEMVGLLKTMIGIPISGGMMNIPSMP